MSSAIPVDSFLLRYKKNAVKTTTLMDTADKTYKDGFQFLNPN